MKNNLKSIICTAIAVIFAVTSMPISDPVQAKELETQQSEVISALETLELDEQEPVQEYVMESDSISARTAERTGSTNTSSNITWDITGGKLTISGSGKMEDYPSGAPWYSQRYSITEVEIAEGITSIGEAAFYGCIKIEEIDLPNSVTRINKAAFANCTKLDRITFGNKLTTIAEYAFQNCQLLSIELPASLTSLNYLAFFKASSLIHISVAAGNVVYQSNNGVLFTSKGSTLMLYPAGLYAASYTIPSTVTKVGKGAFLGADITTITIPQSVKTLEESAFQESKITSLTIPASVTSIGDFLCYGCPDLQKLVIGSGLASLSYQAFRQCTSLTSVNLGKVKDLNRLAFANCTKLEEITIPSGVTSILNGSFGECTSLKKVVLPKGMKEIAYQAFLNCTSLTSINFPSGMTAIYRYAFYGCSALKSVTLPSTMTEIGENAFPATTKLNIPSGLVKMEDGSYKVVAKVKISVAEEYKKAFEVLTLVNKERSKSGLTALKMDQSLLETSMLRAAETSLYWSHTRPNGNDCFSASTMMTAENIAVGSQTAANVMNLWMNSAGHRSNIMSSSSTTIGIGCVKVNGVYYWVQCFGRSSTANASASAYTDKTRSRTIKVSAEKNYYTPTIQLSANSVKAGQTVQVSTTWYNGFTTIKIPQKSLKYKSSDKEVCTVSTAGKIKGIKAGTATITIWFDGYPKGAVTKKVTVKGTQKTYTVKFDKNSGVKLSASSKKVVQGSKIGKLPTVQRKGYSFQGWYTKKSGGSKVTINTKITKAQTLYARWKKMTKPQQTAITGLKNNNTSQLTVQLKKISQADGYQIRYGTNKSFKGSKATTSKTLSKVIKNLTKGKTYYVKARAYKLDSAQNKVYGNYSAVRRLKISK